MLRRSGQVLAQAAQGAGGVTILEVFKKCGDVALGDTMSGHGGVGMMVELGDLK